MTLAPPLGPEQLLFSKKLGTDGRSQRHALNGYPKGLCPAQLRINGEIGEVPSSFRYVAVNLDEM